MAVVFGNFNHQYLKPGEYIHQMICQESINCIINKNGRKYKKIVKFILFLSVHLITWTIVPSLVNNNLPLDVIEALAWGSNLDWGFNKHPPMSAFFPEVLYQIFGPQDWVYYLLSQIFVIISFYIVFKLSIEIFKYIKLSLISVLILESIFYYNFTTPEFNVNVAQLPFWALTVYLAWKVMKNNNLKFYCFLSGFTAAFGLLSKYLFVYILLSIFHFFSYFMFILKKKNFIF